MQSERLKVDDPVGRLTEEMGPTFTPAFHFGVTSALASALRSVRQLAEPQGRSARASVATQCSCQYLRGLATKPAEELGACAAEQKWTLSRGS